MNKLSLRKVFLVLSIIMAPLRSYGIIVAGLNFSLFRICALLLFVSNIFSLGIHGMRLKLKKELRLITAILVVSFLAIIYSSSISGNHSNFASVIFGFFWLINAFVSFETSDIKCRTLIKAFIASSVFPIAIGFYQFVYYSSFNKLPELPFSFLVASERGAIMYNVYTRVFSVFGDPTYYGGFLSALIVLIVGVLLYRKNFSLRKYEVFFLYIILFLGFASILITLSLSSILGTIIGILALLLIGHRFITISWKQVLFVITTVLVLIVFASTNSYVSAAVNNVFYKINTSSQTVDNLFGRSEFIMNSLFVFANHPFLGAGFGGLRLTESGYSTGHSSFLTILGQQGLFVFFLHILLLFVYPIQKIKRSKGKTKAYCVLVFSVLLGVITISIAYDILYSMDICYVLIFLNSIAPTRQMEREVRNEKNTRLNVCF